MEGSQVGSDGLRTAGEDARTRVDIEPINRAAHLAHMRTSWTAHGESGGFGFESEGRTNSLVRAYFLLNGPTMAPRGAKGEPPGETVAPGMTGERGGVVHFLHGLLW